MFKHRHTCSFMYHFPSLTRDIQRNDNSTYILGSGDIHSEGFGRKIGNMMYSQCLHDLGRDNSLDSRTTITAFFNEKDSIVLQFFHPATEDGRAPHGLSITKSVVVSGTGIYGHVNSVHFKVTALINGDKRYIFVNPKKSTSA